MSMVYPGHVRGRISLSPHLPTGLPDKGPAAQCSLQGAALEGRFALSRPTSCSAVNYGSLDHCPCFGTSEALICLMTPFLKAYPPITPRRADPPSVCPEYSKKSAPTPMNPRAMKWSQL